ncbi:ABC transporter substrate-binding protein [Sphingomonas bacterium]|uniref:ABC transporter substrate-binding protein n=1 Tax=Sphingomonas bacterium TaxID=1895847 RepID=UPI001C2CCEA9|nr:ABC transporter substrate-binding protein [Sphingomonas bacterium]
MRTAFVSAGLAGAAIVAVAAATMFRSDRNVPPTQDRTLTISVYGFSQDDYSTILYKPFEAQCGCKVIVEVGNSSERLAKLDANRAHPVIDIAVLATSDALEAARSGLLAKIDASKLANYPKLYDIAKDPNRDGMAVGYTIYSTSIVYRADKVAITSWGDLLSNELSGYVALPSVYTNQGPQTFYMIGRAMGSSRSDLQVPIDAVGARKDAVATFYVRASQLAQLFGQEEIWAAPVGRFAWASLKKSRLPLRWATPKEGQIGSMNVMVLVKGSKHADLARRFIDFWLSTEVQTKLAQRLIDSPANKDVRVPPEIADNLTYGPDMIRQLRFMDSVVVVNNKRLWLAKANRVIGQ